MANYTKYDWASDRMSRMNWADEEDRLITRLDRRMSKRSKRTKNNKRNHKLYA